MADIHISSHRSDQYPIKDNEDIKQIDDPLKKIRKNSLTNGGDQTQRQTLNKDVTKITDSSTDTQELANRTRSLTSDSKRQAEEEAPVQSPVKKARRGAILKSTDADSFVANQRETPQSLYDIKFVCARVVQLCNNDPSRAIKVIENLSESNDIRFNGKDPKFSFPKDKVLRTLQTFTSQANLELGDVTKKEKAMVAMQLVGIIQRNDIKNNDSVTQNACHAEMDTEGRITLSKDKTSASAELAKTERDVRTLANTASLTMNGNVIGFRSAKTHHVHLQEQRSKADIASRVAATDFNSFKNIGETINGLTFESKNNYGKNIYSYQPVIFTMMDSAPVKGAATSAQGVIERTKQFQKKGLKNAKSVPIENERKFLLQMKKANKERFPDDSSSITHKVLDPKTGQTIFVKEKHAIIQNHVFSGQSKSAANRRQARIDNIPGQLRLLKMFCKKNPDLVNISSNQSSSDIINALKEAISKTNEKSEERLVLKAFLANLSGEGPDKYDYDKADSGADLAILTSIQTNYLGLSFSAQCKSGNDRTIAAIAHNVASNVFHNQKGYYFDPETANANDRDSYKKLYTDAVNTFGFPNVEASRGPVRDDGKSGLKIKNSPAAHKYLNVEDVCKYGDIIQ